MAGNWIKIEEATLDKPEVLAMAEMLGTSADDVVGKLLRVWFWFDKQSLDGYASGVTNVTLDKFIDRHVASQGFAQTMRKVGWLSDSGLPNFERHNGETAKNRALTNKRMKKMRNASVTPTASPEKNREDITPIVPGFDKFWNAYPGPRKIGKAKCLALWQSQKLEPIADRVLQHVAAMAASQQWRKEGGKFVPSSLTYLNQRRFEDGLPEPEVSRLAV